MFNPIFWRWSIYMGWPSAIVNIASRPNHAWSEAQVANVKASELKRWSRKYAIFSLRKSPSLFTLKQAPTRDCGSRISIPSSGCWDSLARRNIRQFLKGSRMRVIWWRRIRCSIHSKHGKAQEAAQKLERFLKFESSDRNDIAASLSSTANYQRQWKVRNNSEYYSSRKH